MLNEIDTSLAHVSLGFYLSSCFRIIIIDIVAKDLITYDENEETNGIKRERESGTCFA